MLDKTVVFSLTANNGLAEEICQKLGLDLGKCSTVNRIRCNLKSLQIAGE